MRGREGEPHRLIAVESRAHPDGAAVELDAGAARSVVGDDATCVVDFDGDPGRDVRVRRVRVLPRFAPGAPPLWFAEHLETAARPPATTFVAFTGGDRERGELLDAVDAAERGVRSTDQVGALRWYPATGELDQLYVDPAWRRRHVAAVLISAANAVSLARGWPRLWADGQRTELGERLRAGRSWRTRADDLTHLAPPMTPGG